MFFLKRPKKAIANFFFAQFFLQTVSVATVTGWMWRSQAPPLQQDAVLLLGGGLRVEEGPHGLGEHLLDAVLVERRALQVAHGLDLAGEGGALMVADRHLVLLLQLPLGLAVVPEVALRADQEDGDAGAVVRHLETTTHVF